MVDRRREVLFGKLAIGRGALARDAAVRCFHAGTGEPLWDVAVREGLLARGVADDLLRLADSGTLVCRGTCGFSRPLEGEPPDGDRCDRCGGPLYASAAAPGPDAFGPTWRGPGPGEAREAIPHGRSNGPSRPAPPPDPAPAPEPSADGEVTIAEVDRPALGPGDSLPSAIPIPAPARPASAGTSSQDPPTIAPRTRRYGDRSFAPFSINAGTTTYEVIAPIGKGGMGSVYRARHRAMNAIVAIKILTNATTDQRKRFDREVKTMARLDHPNVVRVLGGGMIQEKGDFEGAPFFAMEYVPGRDLAAWAHERPRSPGECAAMLVTICEAIHFAHNRSVIHRDLKPANVIVTHQGDVPKICDFGLAKVSSHDETDITLSGAIMGTPQFMPPEQMLGRRTLIGPPTDVYSLGAMLYYLLTGGPPFTADKLIALMDRVVKEAPAPIRQKNPRCPPELDAVVIKALAKKPVERFHTARDLGRALAGLGLPL